MAFLRIHLLFLQDKPEGSATQTSLCFHPGASSTFFSLELYIATATFYWQLSVFHFAKMESWHVKICSYFFCRSSVLSDFVAGQRFSEASPLPFVAEPATTKGSFTAVSAQTICPVICVLTEVTMGGPHSHERIHSGHNNEGFCSPIETEPQKSEPQDLSLCLLPHCSGKQKKTYLERSVKDAEDNIREMLMSRRAQ